MQKILLRTDFTNTEVSSSPVDVLIFGHLMISLILITNCVNNLVNIDLSDKGQFSLSEV